jgi:hypothetical protein
LIVKEVKHSKQANLIQLNKFLVNSEQIFVFIACEPPKVGEPLNRSLLIRRVVSIEGSLHSFCELIGEILAKAND